MEEGGGECGRDRAESEGTEGRGRNEGNRVGKKGAGRERHEGARRNRTLGYMIYDAFRRFCAQV